MKGIIFTENIDKIMGGAKTRCSLNLSVWGKRNERTANLQPPNFA
jgi:hypothetical protein